MKDLYLCTTFIVFAALSVGCGTPVGEAGDQGKRLTSGVSYYNNGNEIDGSQGTQNSLSKSQKPKHFHIYHQITIY